MERNWTDELERCLRQQYVELCQTIGHPVPLTGLRISPPPGEEEAKYFLLGLEEELFRLNDNGEVTSQLFRVDEATRPAPYQIFGRDFAPPRLMREAVCQLATASLLVLKKGWLKSHVTLEPGSDEHRTGGVAFDLLVRSPGGKVLVWIEVRRSAVELQKLIADLRACSRRGPHPRQECGFPQNHPRYEFGLSLTPDFLWAVSPDADICLRMSYQNGTMELEELRSLPPRSLLE